MGTRRVLTLVSLLAAAGCTEAPEPRDSAVERFDPRLDRIIDTRAPVDTLGEGFTWSEGPVWVPELDALLFSDVPENRIHAWSADIGVRVWLEPSGYTGVEPRGGEPGSNGLLLDPDGRLVLCQHGDRRMARLVAPLTDPAPEFETIVGTWDGRRFSSPNDATYRSDGSLWFTDPPYGLTPGRQAEEREIPFNGVYALFPNGHLVVVTDTLTRPNGIAFSPDGGTLYVAVSDGSAARWVAYDVAEDGTVTGGRVLLDVTGRAEPGLPDGLAVQRSGVLFATGPGGVWIIHPDGTPLGRIRTTEATANVAFGQDGRSLFMTSDSRLLRIRVL